MLWLRIEPPTSEGRPLTLLDRLRLSPPAQGLFGSLQLLGLRNRLCCPACRAVGTYKPHGTWVARIFYKDRPVRRWMCKWCGLYLGPEGVLRVYPDLALGCWALPAPWYPDANPRERQITPKDAVAQLLSNDESKPVWPWRG